MLIDTSGWFCLFDRTDFRHKNAFDLYRSATLRITHSYILSELVALAISNRHSLSRIVPFVQDILVDTEIRTIWVDEILTWRAIDLLNSRLDKTWSLCDAASFVIMKDERISESLTTDHHFEQAGFIKLLES